MTIDSLIQHTQQLIGNANATYIQLQNIYTQQDISPLSLNNQLLHIRDQLTQLNHQLKTTGLGALTANKEPDQDDTLTLDQLQQDFQALYHQRQNQRDAANIVLGVMNASSSTTTTTDPIPPSTKTT